MHQTLYMILQFHDLEIGLGNPRRTPSEVVSSFDLTDLGGQDIA